MFGGASVSLVPLNKCSGRRHATPTNIMAPREVPTFNSHVPKNQTGDQTPTKAENRIKDFLTLYLIHFSSHGRGELYEEKGTACVSPLYPTCYVEDITNEADMYPHQIQMQRMETNHVG